MDHVQSRPGQQRVPLRIARQGYFYVGGRYKSGADGGTFVTGQMYVEYQIPAKSGPALGGRLTRYPLVFIHGGGHTGVGWQGTPDGRPGWADFFLGKGWPVYVVDQPGRGRSAANPGAYGPMAAVPSVLKARQQWAASEQFDPPPWPQAGLHSRWPGGSQPNDPVFDQYYAHLVPGLASQMEQEDATTSAVVALLERIGPAVLIEHSQPGPVVWRVADMKPELVRGIVAVEPTGPPFYERDGGNIERHYGPCRGPLTYDPPLRDASELKLVQQEQPDGPGLMKCWLQAGPPRKLPRLAGRPILFMLSESSYHAPYDHCTSLYLKQAGVDHEFVRLADLGIHGNGHLMMVEDNSLELAKWLERWLVRRLAAPRHKRQN